MSWKMNRREWRSLSLFVVVLAVAVGGVAAFSPRGSESSAESDVNRVDSVVSCSAVAGDAPRRDSVSSTKAAPKRKKRSAPRSNRPGERDSPLEHLIPPL